ncbi:MAG: protein kinase [Planctomycetales bacterium]|nr:protein kinase [Planctomycetales bacterium]
MRRLNEIAAKGGKRHSFKVELQPDAGRRAYENVMRRRKAQSNDPEFDQSPTAGEIAEAPGATIGKYKLLEQIGEGGFGVVYMAEQLEPVSRRVALKIIKPGMDTKQVVARFEAERQALAMMDHRNIARVLEGGETESGRPYFVMELVQGLPITEFCDENKLTSLQRLELFVPVCHAVQSAHQKGIIHRDIKPSNVMVTLEGTEAVPMVIDFGIAKATNQRLTERTCFTAFGQMVGTPSYMSPEQAGLSNLDIDTRVDVYALGVLLYELLTGTTPFSNDDLRAAGWNAMLQIIAEKNPQTPSRRINTIGRDSTLTSKHHSTIAANRRTQFPALEKQLRGDLDWIAMKCLEKDRTRRYETPAELAADVKRFLNRETVLAVAPSRWYSFKKFYARNKVAVAAAIVVATSLLFATLFSFRAADIARSNAHLAKVSADAALLAREKEAAARSAAEEVAESQRRQIYALDIYRAGQFLKEGSRKAAHNLLNKQVPSQGRSDLRGVSWDFLKSQLRQSVQCTHTLEDGTDEIAISPSGRWLAHEDDETQTVVVRETMKPFEIVKRLPNPGVVIEFSHNDRFLMIATGHNGVRIYETETWKEIRRWNNWTYPALFSPDGRLFGCKHHGDPRLHVYSTETWDENGEEFSVLMSDFGLPWWLRRHSVVFSANGQYLVYPSPGTEKDALGTFSFYNIDENAVDERLSGTIPYGQTISMSPDGTTVAADDPEVRTKIDVWDLTNKKPTRIKELRQHRYAVSRVQYTPDGRHLISIGGDEQVVVWDAKRHTYSRSLWGHLDQLWAMAISPDSKTLFTGASREYPAIKVWDIDEPLRPDSAVVGGMIGFATDDKLLLTCDLQCKVRMWNDDGSPTPIATIADNHNDIGICMVNGARAWTTTSDGETLVVGYRNGRIRTWNVATGDEQEGGIPVEGHSICALTPNPTQADELFVVTFKRTRDEQGANHDVCRILVWDHSNRKVIRELSTHNEVCHISVSPDGQILAVCEFRSCHVYSLPSAEKLFVHESARPIWAKPDFSEDSTKLALGIANLARILDAATGEQLMELRAHAMGVFAVNFTPDGNTLITSNDSVKFWHLPTQTDVITLPGDGTLLTKLVTTSDRHRLFVSSGMFARKVETIEIPITRQ